MLAFSPAWISLARQNVPITVAADAMKCSKATAAKRLDQAHAVLQKSGLGSLATPRQEAAVSLLQHSGASSPVIGRGNWHGIVLGLKKAV